MKSVIVWALTASWMQVIISTSRSIERLCLRLRLRLLTIRRHTSRLELPTSRAIGPIAFLHVARRWYLTLHRNRHGNIWDLRHGELLLSLQIAHGLEELLLLLHLLHLLLLLLLLCEHVHLS